jgi:hypothetical protein
LSSAFCAASRVFTAAACSDDASSWADSASSSSSSVSSAELSSSVSLRRTSSSSDWSWRLRACSLGLGHLLLGVGERLLGGLALAGGRGVVVVRYDVQLGRRGLLGRGG